MSRKPKQPAQAVQTPQPNPEEQPAQAVQTPQPNPEEQPAQAVQNLGDREAELQAKIDELQNQLAQKNAPQTEFRKAVQPKLDDSGKNIFGNQDLNHTTPFSIKWIDSVVVRQSVVQQVGNDKVELPSSVQIVPYDTYMYDHLVKTEGFGDMKHRVLHDPRK